MPNSHPVKSMLRALPLLPFHICSQVIPGTQYDTHLTNIKLSFCVRPCLSCEKGSRVYKVEDSVAFKRTYNLERKVTCTLELSTKEVQLQKLLESRKKKAVVTVRMLRRSFSNSLGFAWWELHGGRCTKPYVLTTQAHVGSPANICCPINPDLGF